MFAPKESRRVTMVLMVYDKTNRIHYQYYRFYDDKNKMSVYQCADSYDFV